MKYFDKLKFIHHNIHNIFLFQFNVWTITVEKADTKIK